MNLIDHAIAVTFGAFTFIRMFDVCLAWVEGRVRAWRAVRYTEIYGA